jgi:hypothetical protein
MASDPEERLERERSFQMHTLSAYCGLCFLIGSFAFTTYLAVQNVRAGRSVFELPSGPLYLALFGVVMWSAARRRLKALAQIQKKEDKSLTSRQSQCR